MRKIIRLFQILFILELASALIFSQADAAEVVIVGDTQLKLVAEIVSGIRKTLHSSINNYSIAEAKGALRSIVEKERARVVIALGRDALSETQNLPQDIPVIYGFILTPPAIARANTTGIYMATPAREYANLIKKHLHSIKKLDVIGSFDQLNVLAAEEPARWSTHNVKNSIEFVNTLKRLDKSDAILLLPNVSILTAATMEETYLLSFRKNIPLLGVSERQVRDGALFALVAEMNNQGRSIGEYAAKVMSGTPVAQLPPAPAKRFELYLNAETARKMGVPLTDELLKTARRVYP